MQKLIPVPEREFKRLKKIEKLDTELLKDISRGIKDILIGKIKEV